MCDQLPEQLTMHNKQWPTGCLPCCHPFDKCCQGRVIDCGGVVGVGLFHPVNLSRAPMCRSCVSHDLHSTQGCGEQGRCLDAYLCCDVNTMQAVQVSKEVQSSVDCIHAGLLHLGLCSMRTSKLSTSAHVRVRPSAKTTLCCMSQHAQQAFYNMQAPCCHSMCLCKS